MKRIGQLFLFYFGLLGIYLLWGWVKYIGNSTGEMGDAIFFLLWLCPSVMLTVLIAWTFRLYRNNKDSFSARSQYGLIFIFIVLSLFCLCQAYN